MKKIEKKSMLKRIMSVCLTLALFVSCFATMTPVTSQAASNVINAKMDTVVTGMLETSDDYQLYKFKTTKSGYINLTFSADGIDYHGYGWAIDIYDEEYNYLYGYDYVKGVEQQFISGKIEMGKNVTFYVKVSANASYSAPLDIEYKLCAKQTQKSNWEQGNNGTYLKAEKLTTKKKTYGTIWRASDVDFYKYKVKNTGYTQFLFTAEEASTSYDHWEVYFYDKNLNCIYYEDNITQLCRYSNKFNFKKGTTIYIKVVGGGVYDTPVDYTYSIKPIEKSTTAWETENNNNFKKATTLPAKGKKGTCLNSSDIDFYKYKAKSTGTKKLRFTMESDTNCGSGWNIEIYNSKKECVARYTYIRQDKIIKYKMKKNATYYIKVYPYSSYGANGDDEYKLRIS